MTLADERRSRPRARTAIDLELDLPGAAAPARVRDISGSGVSCVTDRAIPVWTEVQLTLLLPSARGDGTAPRRIVCRGAVVRSRPASHPGQAGAGAAFETAIFFTAMRDSDREDVESFVSTTLGPAAAAG